jgi:hypothetical protein
MELRRMDIEVRLGVSGDARLAVLAAARTDWPGQQG